MEGYNKTVLRNHKGEVLLPRTTASMVGEESDRRFVDNVEKTLLNTVLSAYLCYRSISQGKHQYGNGPGTDRLARYWPGQG